MAKKKADRPEAESVEEVAAPAIAEAQAVQVPEFLSRMIDASARKYGKRGAVASGERKVIGMEPYSLALQWLMDLQVIPLQMIMVIAGEPKTYKTSALLEICRIASELKPLPGISVITNTEGKWSPSKVSSMMREATPLVQLHQATSIEDWQERVGGALKVMKDAIEKKSDAVKRGAKSSEYKNMGIPVMVAGVDSVTGSQSEHIKEQVMEEGFGKKTYQDRAMINWQWYNTWGSGLLGMPAIIVLVQHLKDKIDNTATMPVKVTSGGSGGNFMCGMEIRVKKIKEIQTARSEGALLQWQMNLNSYGRDKRRIVVPYIETYDDHDQQIAYFDWDACLVELIKSFDDQPMMRERVRGVIGAVVEHAKVGFGPVYSCEGLGIDKDRALEDSVSATVLGKMLQLPGGPHRDPLRQALRIQPAEQWTPETEL